MDQPPAVALTAFPDAWPRARETEIGAALCAIGAGRTLTFDLIMLVIFIAFSVFLLKAEVGWVKVAWLSSCLYFPCIVQFESFPSFSNLKSELAGLDYYAIPSILPHVVQLTIQLVAKNY